MSRSGYSDDYEFVNLWQGTVSRAIKGKRGQKLLIDLAEALDEMPIKRLITMDLKNNEGEFCTLGVLGAKRGFDLEKIDPEQPECVAKKFDIATAMAQEIVYQNDEWFGNCTPEERWTRMRAWVQENIKDIK